MIVKRKQHKLKSVDLNARMSLIPRFRPKIRYKNLVRLRKQNERKKNEEK